MTMTRRPGVVRHVMRRNELNVRPELGGVANVRVYKNGDAHICQIAKYDFPPAPRMQAVFQFTGLKVSSSASALAKKPSLSLWVMTGTP